MFSFLSDIYAKEVDFGIERYSKMIPDRIVMLPSDDDKFFSEKITKLLKGAISNFMIQNGLGTISLCGIVGENLTNLTFEIWNKEKGKMSKKDQKIIFGNEFIELNQKRKISILGNKEIISPKTQTYLNEIRDIRNNYVHLYSTDMEHVDDDALKIFKLTNKMIQDLIKFDVKNRIMYMDAHFARYAESKINPNRFKKS